MARGTKDYPRTTGEFNERFQTEDACWHYLVRLRWPKGFKCGRCGSEKSWLNARKLFECAGCHRQESVTAGTIFQDTRKPLRLWFQVIWWVVGQKQGASALGLNRVLDIGCYKTAWTWLQKLRRAMVRPGRDRLSGEVEVDETYVGGVKSGGGGRRTGNKALVGIAAQKDGRGIGRIRLGRIPDASGDSLIVFIKKAVEPGSLVVTDGWGGFNQVEEAGYRHRAKVVSHGQRDAATRLPRVHRVASLLKRWLLGTHQGAVSREHLEYYLDEFTFRFNRRSSTHRGLLFYRLLEQAVAVPPVPFRDLAKGIRGPRTRRRTQDRGVT